MMNVGQQIMIRLIAWVENGANGQTYFERG